MLVEHEADFAGGPQRHGLGTVTAARREAQLVEQHLDVTGVLRLELDEVESHGRLGVRHGSGARPAGGGNAATLSCSQTSDRRACTAVRSGSV